MNLGKKETEIAKISENIGENFNGLKSELIIDLLGPIIDMTKIPVLKEVPGGRYRDKDEMATILTKMGMAGFRRESVNSLIGEFLNPAFHVSIIDMDVLERLVEAKRYAIIKIISSVKDTTLLRDIIDKVIEKSEVLCKHLKRRRKERDTRYVQKGEDGQKGTNEEEDFKVLEWSDFVRIGSDEQIEGVGWASSMNDLIKEDKEIYRIVFSEEKDDLEDGGRVREWISGVSDKDCMEKLKEKIEKMKQIARIDHDLKKLLPEGKEEITIGDYSVSKNFKFYVFEERARKGLESRITEIERILNAEKKDKRGDKPICVFLAGAPGAGKSYFVKLLTKSLRSDGECLSTSLSGVPGKMFAYAVKRHIVAVYEKCKKEKENNIVAFLDEVDTDGGGKIYAYRFLMDAMTGNVMDDTGNLVKNAEARKLVWLFAGSAKISREEFVKEFYDHERKVADFFDRIHFYILLPSVQRSGQAILTFLSALDRPEGKDRITVTQSVLYLFGRTVWKSARQIKTVCRIASARNRFDWDGAIDLKCFGGIDVLTEFVTTHKVVKDMEDMEKEKKLKEVLQKKIIIKFTDET